MLDIKIPKICDERWICMSIKVVLAYKSEQIEQKMDIIMYCDYNKFDSTKINPLETVQMVLSIIC